MKENIKKRRARKLQNSIEGTLSKGFPPRKILGTILEVDQRTKKPMTMHKALLPRDDVDRLYVSRREGEEDLPALKTAWTHRYNDSKTT